MFDFKLPDLGEGVHEGQVVSLLIKEGDAIAEYQPMMEVETDKAAVEIPSPKAGVVAKWHVKAGQVVKVGDVMITIDESGAGAGKAPAAASKPAAAPAPAKPAEAPRKAVEAPASAVAAASAVPEHAGMRGDGFGRAERPAATMAAVPAATMAAPVARREGPVPAAPVVRKLAREMGVDLQMIPGSGPHGRVLREDVERFALGHRGGAPATGPARQAHPAPAVNGGDAQAFALPTEELPDFSQYGPVRREPAPQIRKTIARQMTRAWLNVPRVTHHDEADITELERNRKRLNEKLRPGQAKMTITAIVLKAVAAALREYPMLNCSYDAKAGEIVYKDYVHLGVAVDTPRGLVVPVVRDVEKKSLPQVAKELNDVAERVKSGKFDIADLRGATFTITNVGAIGGTGATPMVNFPEVGILGMLKAAHKPVVRDGQIVPRLILPLSLSFDHRICDGADAARFTSDVIHSLENPLRLISM